MDTHQLIIVYAQSKLIKARNKGIAFADIMDSCTIHDIKKSTLMTLMYIKIQKLEGGKNLFLFCITADMT